MEAEAWESPGKHTRWPRRSRESQKGTRLQRRGGGSDFPVLPEQPPLGPTP